MAEEAATSLHHHRQQQQNLQESHHFNHICWDSNGVREVCEKSRAALDSLKQLFLICWKEEETASPTYHHHHHRQNLPTPYRLMNFSWDSNECGDACEKSKEAFNDLKLFSIPPEPQLEQQRSHLLNGLSNKNLFLIHIETGKTTKYVSYSRERHDWGSNDIMVNLRGDTTLEQRMAYLKCAAHFRGGAVHLLHLKVLTRDEQSAWLDALALASQRNEAPKSLLISKCDFDIYHVLSALKKFNGLDHLSLQWIRINDQCVEVLRDFTSLTSLHLEGIDVSGNFVGNLAELRPAHLSLSSSLQRLHIDSICIDWRRSTGFLHNWPKLQELSLSTYEDMREDKLINFMAHLAPPFMEEQKSGSVSTSPLQLYSLDMQRNIADSHHLGYSSAELSPSAVAAVVDALARSGIPFFQHPKMDPAIQAQLWRNQRNRMLRSGWEQAPATSMPLLICGDSFSGKTTLVSTMLSVYASILFRRGRTRRISSFPGRTRTRGIKVRAIHLPVIPSMRNKLRNILIRRGTQGDPIQRIAVTAIEREGIRLLLWDIPGQQQFPAFQDCMFHDMPSLWVFVWSPVVSENSDRGSLKSMEDFEASFRYWLRFFASKRRQSNTTLKVIVVCTRADQGVPVSSSLSPSIDTLRSDFLGVIEIVDPPFEVDTRHENSVKTVTEHFFKVAKEMLQGVKVYSICNQVSKQLFKHLKSTNERIITWKKFTKICKHSSLNGTVNLNTIASALSELGSVIYTNKATHIVLDPNWFYNHIIASLIRFTKSEPSKDTLVFNNGCVAREFLEGNLESTIGFKVDGSLVLRLMEAMHLCCKVGIDHGVSEGNVDLIFIPAILANGGVQQLQWASSSATCNLDDNDTYVYRGRRLECENKDITFLTPGIFSRIQILFNNAFQSNANIMLGKDSISIRFADKEIIVVLCQAKSNYVIDVLVRAVNNTEVEDTPRTLAYVERHIINSLITILAQATGIQGVKLIESVIRPECLLDPSRAQDREDQCMQINYLKEQLREKLERGEPKCFEWKSRNTDMPWTLQTNYDLVDLLGFENYWGILISCKAWLELVSGYGLLRNDEDNVLEQAQSHQNLTITSLKNNLMQERQILEDAIEVQCSMFMVKIESEDAIEVQSSHYTGTTISNLHNKVHATNNEIFEVDKRLSEINEKLEEIHENFKCVRKDVMIKIKKSIGKLLKLPVENEDEMQLPRVAILTTNGDNGIANPVILLSGMTSVRIQLYCEDHILPHPVQNQPGITLTSLSKSQSKFLSKALPYINAFFYVLSVAIIMGIDSVHPLPNPAIPDWTHHRELAKQYPLLSSTIESIKDISTSSTMFPECPSMIEAFNEWQKWLASVLVENGGLTDQNIADKFGLRRAIYDDKTGGSSQVAWLCVAHHQTRSRKDAETASLQPYNHQKHQKLQRPPKAINMRPFFHEMEESFERPVQPADNLSLPHDSNLPRPHCLIIKRWGSLEIGQACDESRAALDSLKPLSITLEGVGDHHELGHQLSQVIKVKNLFLIASKKKLEITYGSYINSNVRGEQAWKWGSKDMMLDLGDASKEQRMAILTAAANLTRRAVHLILYPHYNLSKEEEKCWVEALSLAADRDAGPSSLIIKAREFRDVPGLLSALKKNRRLKHLSLQDMKISDECMELLGDFRYLISLHLHNVRVSSRDFVGKLSDLHHSQSPLTASLCRLHIIGSSIIDWRRSIGFLCHWESLKELSLYSSYRIKEEELIHFMEHLAPAKKGYVVPSFPPQLYSLELGRRRGDLSESASSAVLDALSRSGLPFFQILGRFSFKTGDFSVLRNPCIEKQVYSNQRNLISKKGRKRSPKFRMVQ